MKNIKTIINNINSDNAVSIQDLKKIQEYIHKYQFFQIGYAILAKKLNENSITKKALIYATNKNYFKKMMNEEDPFNICPLEKEYFNKSLRETKKDDISEENSLEEILEISFEKKSILKMESKNIHSAKINYQRKLMQNFLNQERKIFKKNISSSQTKDEDLAISSVEISSDILNEELMHMFIDQGKIEELIEIYKKVILENPDKGKMFDNIFKTKKIEIEKK